MDARLMSSKYWDLLSRVLNRIYLVVYVTVTIAASVLIML